MIGGGTKRNPPSSVKTTGLPLELPIGGDSEQFWRLHEEAMQRQVVWALVRMCRGEMQPLVERGGGIVRVSTESGEGYSGA